MAVLGASLRHARLFWVPLSQVNVQTIDEIMAVFRDKFEVDSMMKLSIGTEHFFPGPPDAVGDLKTNIKENKRHDSPPPTAKMWRG